MIIGFDAKRAFQNKTGLGNYSRTLLGSLDEYFGDHQYVLFAPKQTSLFNIRETHSCKVITPEWQPAKMFSSLWRSVWMTRDLKKSGISIYHGLSNELPAGIAKTGIKSVVTIHDLIFEHYPQQYDRTEVPIYRKKFRQACHSADAIIATSVCTKKDIIELYNIPPEKIHVCYQSCNPAFSKKLQREQLSEIRQQYHLPETYFLYVGSIIERKNLLLICKALHALRAKLDIPLVVIGEGKKYKKEVQQWLASQGFSNRIIFLSDTDAAKKSVCYQTGDHFPAIFQNARALIYPSIYEGFGIPILEALNSGIPVIAANSSSLPEVGGDAALYFEPDDFEGLCDVIWKVAVDETVRQQCIQRAEKHVIDFTPQKCAESVLNIYRLLT